MQHFFRYPPYEAHYTEPILMILYYHLCYEHINDTHGRVLR